MNRQTNKATQVHLIFSSVTLAFCITLTVMLGIFGAKASRTEALVKAHSCPTIDLCDHEEDTEASEVMNTPPRIYVLGAKDGKLTVFASDGYTVVDVLDTFVYSLPLSDREAIAKGIPIYTVNELISLIEDYTS